MNTVTYSGRSLWNCNFNLYGYEESFNFEKTKAAILKEFKEQYLKEIKSKLEAIGLKFKSLEYWSPKEYNFNVDSIDLSIIIKDKKKLKAAIENNKEAIQKALDKNKSYDGYMALTIGTVEEELSNIDDPLKDYEPDVIVLTTLLNMDCSDFNLIECFILQCCDCETETYLICENGYCKTCNIKNKCNCKEFD